MIFISIYWLSEFSINRILVRPKFSSISFIYWVWDIFINFSDEFDLIKIKLFE